MWSRGLAGLLSNEHPLLLPCLCLSGLYVPSQPYILLHHPACQGRALRGGGGGFSPPDSRSRPRGSFTAAPTNAIKVPHNYLSHVAPSKEQRQGAL